MSATLIGNLAEQAKIHLTPYIVCELPAGFPSPATDYVEEGLDLNEYMVQNKAASFIFQVKGHSMKNIGIMDGDKVIVDRSIEPRHRMIVIAIFNGEHTIKRLYKRAGRIELHPENSEFKPIVPNDGEELQIWGVVTGVVRRYV